jgi:cytosine/adenosine deaminase-related metal-dependent hydrolase
MAYRKFAADQLFSGYTMLGDEAVLVTDDEGIVLDIIQAPEAGDNIERFNGILSPGFINCHCHLELSHMKDIIPRSTGMVKFLLTVMTDRQSEEKNILDAIAVAEDYMLKNGIVAVGDICNTPFTIPTKRKNNLYYHNFIEATGFVEFTVESRFQLAHDLYLKFIDAGNNENAISVSIVPHAPYSVSDRLFELINNG